MSIGRSHFGFSLGLPQKQSFANALADTGCQSCLAGFKIAKKLGLYTRAVVHDNHDIHILGATILKLSGRNSKGKEKYTRQIDVLCY